MDEAVDHIEDEKYIVFKKEEFVQLMGELGLPPYWERPGDSTSSTAGGNWNCAVIADHILKRVDETKLHDAVVIRTQDVVSPPVLDLYAGVLHLLKGDGDPAADYFHQRAAEAWHRDDKKLPD